MLSIYRFQKYRTEIKTGSSAELGGSRLGLFLLSRETSLFFDVGRIKCTKSKSCIRNVSIFLRAGHIQFKIFLIFFLLTNHMQIHIHFGNPGALKVQKIHFFSNPFFRNNFSKLVKPEVKFIRHHNLMNWSSKITEMEKIKMYLS